MDPLYSSSVLSSASRQVTDPRWPATPVDHEMTSWSPAHERPRLAIVVPVLSALRVSIARLGNWLRRPATSTTG